MAHFIIKLAIIQLIRYISHGCPLRVNQAVLIFGMGCVGATFQPCIFMCG